MQTRNPAINAITTVNTYYVRDAQGNVLAVYDDNNTNRVVQQSELYLYGSSRLGIYRPRANRTVATNGIYTRSLTRKEYELSDHLGNVRAVIGDYRESDGTNPLRAALRSYANYYAFGLEMPGMSWKGGGYRYGYNGKEIDREFQNNYDYGFRIYSAALGRFLSVDPIAGSYPWYTPYQFAGNMPIAAIDLDGLEEVSAIGVFWRKMFGGPGLQKSEWLDEDRSHATRTFANAAKFNTSTLNDRVYEPVDQIHKYYMWAAHEVDESKANIKFFHAARDVTSMTGVGGAYIAPEILSKLSDHGRKSLGDVNKRLLHENMPVIRDILSQGKSSAVQGVGIIWDFNYVNREQTFLTDVVSEDPLGSSDKEAINSNFKTFEFIHPEYTLAKKLLGVEKLDYEPQRQRMAIGRSLVFMKHMEKKGFEGSDEYKQGVQYLNKEYGEQRVKDFLKTYQEEK